ncbi:unnamed protein product [Ilex paraguariensis]|uniref:Uncharacterized protein n=1 Tax=Ilex paraguariensis TaxID=185542 RepID=A0ABC8UY19_9AQUA
MATEDSWKKLKRATVDRLSKPLGLKREKDKNKEEKNKMRNSNLVGSEESLNSFKERKKKNKSSRQKRSRNEGDKVDSEEVHHFHMKDESDEVDRGKRKSKVLGNKKRKNEIIKETMPVEVDKLHNEWESGFDEHNVANEVEEKKRSISRKKKRKHQKLEKAEVDKVDELCNDVKDTANSKNGKSKKAHKMKKKDQLSSRKDVKLLERRGDAEEDEVYQIFAGDDDCSKGMKSMNSYYQIHLVLPVVVISF